MNVPRPRGGQPGNQNARKHGYYSAVFTGQDKANLNQAIEIDGLDEEIALIRARLKSVVKNEPDNLRLISEAASTLARLIRTNQKLGLSGPEKFEQARWNVLFNVLSQFGYTKEKIVELYLGKTHFAEIEKRSNSEQSPGPEGPK